jgi:hypothetical protein
MQAPSEKHLDASVRDTAGSCLGLFVAALRANHTALDAVSSLHTGMPPPDYERLTIERDRFRIWAANAAAFAQGRSSLDYRLRELPDELDQVKSLLGTISSRLQAYESALAKASTLGLADANDTLAEEQPNVGLEFLASPPQSDPFQPARNKDPNPEIKEGTGGAEGAHEAQESPKPASFHYDEALESIHTNIDWLHRLSNLLRKASIINQNLHAQSYRLSGLDGDGLRKFFFWVVRRDFPGLSEQLKGRMASTMVERQRRILYRRERYGSGWKQEESYRFDDHQVGAEKVTKPQLLSPSIIDPATRILTQEEPVTEPSTKCDPSSLLKSEVTEPDRLRYNAPPSSIHTARSAALDHDAEMLVPPPPPECQTQVNFTCDFCCMILDSRIGRLNAQWTYVTVFLFKPF